MKLIDSKVEYLPQENGLENIYKQIELAGRTCYMSQDKITEDSSKIFVDRMVKSGHGAMLEHGTVYLGVPLKNIFPAKDSALDRYTKNKYSKIKDFRCIIGKKIAITTNYRVLVENGWIDDLQYLCEPTEEHEKRYSFRITTSIGISRELLRHRTMSFAEQSTRYCNFSNDKFCNELTFVKPYWYDKSSPACQMNFNIALNNAEDSYMRSVKNELKAQEARELLPLCTKTEIIITGFETDWKHFLELRSSKAGAKGAHPDMEIIADIIYS